VKQYFPEMQLAQSIITKDHREIFAHSVHIYASSAEATQGSTNSKFSNIYSAGTRHIINEKQNPEIRF